MSSRRFVAPFAIGLAFVLLGGVIPQPEVCITLNTAGILVGGYSIYVFFADRQQEENPVVDDEKHIVLFRQPQAIDEDSVVCRHCGEVYGLGIKVCPRCKRPA